MFTPMSFLIRWVLGMAVVFSAYNTSGYSYYHWVTDGSSTDWPLKMFLGLCLLAMVGIASIQIWRAMGPVGVSASVASLTALVWILVDLNLLDLNANHTVGTVVETLIATILTFGVSWSHIRTRLSGQIDVKDIWYY
jgi:hypothetical protein